MNAIKLNRFLTLNDIENKNAWVWFQIIVCESHLMKFIKRINEAEKECKVICQTCDRFYGMLNDAQEQYFKNEYAIHKKVISDGNLAANALEKEILKLRLAIGVNGLS